MIITKLKQFIIFDCDQNETPISTLLTQEVRNKIFTIEKVSLSGLNFRTWSNTSLINNYDKLTPNTIYLVTTRPGQTGYEIPGAVDAENYCSNKITSNFTLNIDGYHIILDKFFDKNKDIYYFDSNQNNKIIVPDNCDYLVSFNSTNKQNRNFSIFSNENDYPNLFFQYDISNLNPQISEELIVSVRVINPNNTQARNISLSLKQNFDLNFQGNLISPRPPSYFDLNPNSYFEIELIYKVNNPPSSPIILDEPKLNAIEVTPGQIIQNIGILNNSKNGVLIGSVDQGGHKDIDIDKMIEVAKIMREKKEECRKKGNGCQIQLDLKAGGNSLGWGDKARIISWLQPPTDADKVKRAKALLQKILLQNGGDMTVEVYCKCPGDDSPNDNNRYYPPNGSNDNVGPINCEQDPKISPPGIEPGCEQPKYPCADPTAGGAIWPKGEGVNGGDTCPEKYRVNGTVEFLEERIPCPIECINPPDCECPPEQTQIPPPSTQIPPPSTQIPPPSTQIPPPSTQTPEPTPKPECKRDSDCLYEGSTNGYFGFDSCMNCVEGKCISNLRGDLGEVCCGGKRCTGQCCTGCMDGFGPSYQHCCDTDINGWPAHCVNTTNGDGVSSGTCCEGCPGDPNNPGKPDPSCGGGCNQFMVGNI